MSTITSDPKHGAIDPVTFSVIRSRFEAIGEEMTLALERAAWSSLLSLARDYSCMIYDAHEDGPRQVTMADCLPIHCNSVRTLLLEVLDTFGDDIHDGDVIMVNDPYGGNTHLPDVVTAAPVFVEGELTFWSVARGHQLDIGAMEPSSIVPSATTIFQEGLIIPPVKIFERGRECSDIFRLYLANVRYGESMNADLRAQLGSVGVARRQLIALCEKYGRSMVLQYLDALMDYAERRAAEEFKQIPNGVYQGISWLDNDGISATDIPIKATVTVQDGSIHVDYSGSGPQSKGSANCTYAVMQAASTIPFLCYIDPDIPQNHGMLRHISAEAELGSICLARYPAATGQATQGPSERMQDAINIAMASAIPDRVPAGTPHCANIVGFDGIHPETGEPWACMSFNGGGGQGAARGADGWPLFHSLSGLGGLTSGSVEQMEMMYPFLIEEMEVEPDSMGCGEWIGGPGVRTRYSPVGESMQSMAIGDGYRNPPHGVNGGTMSPGGGIYVEHLDGCRTYTSATAQALLRAGETLNSISPGGGGWGDPLCRDAELVRRNLRDGFITATTAREIFGVVCNDDSEMTLDLEATGRLRDELRAQRKPSRVEPTVPGTGSWARQRLRDGDRYIEISSTAKDFVYSTGAC
jgi:N-methylhydantoinase B